MQIKPNEKQSLNGRAYRQSPWKNCQYMKNDSKQIIKEIQIDETCFFI